MPFSEKVIPLQRERHKSYFFIENKQSKNMNNSFIINILSEFNALRSERIGRFPSPNDRKAYADAVASCFMPCAQRILAGCFQVNIPADGDPIKRTIYPTAIELYYHEEGEGRFKDPIMYHTDDRKFSEHKEWFAKRGITELPYFPLGNLNPHTSGVDVTFENPRERYRASFLIREYKVVYENGTNRPVKNSTDIYDDMLPGGMPWCGEDWITWCDGGVLDETDIVRRWRRNVPDYRPKADGSGQWEKNPDGEPTFAAAGGRYAKCPFDWQFARKEQI